MLAMCKRDVRPAPAPNNGLGWIEREAQTLGAKQASSEDQRVQPWERGRLYERMPLMRLGQYLRTVATGSGALRALFYEQNIETQEVEKEAEALYDEYDWVDVELPMACQRISHDCKCTFQYDSTHAIHAGHPGVCVLCRSQEHHPCNSSPPRMELIVILCAYHDAARVHFTSHRHGHVTTSNIAYARLIE